MLALKPPESPSHSIIDYRPNTTGVANTQVQHYFAGVITVTEIIALLPLQKHYLFL